MPVRRNLIVSGVVVEPGLARTIDHTYCSCCPITLRITTWNLEYGRRLVHWYMIVSDPLPHVSLRGTVISKLLAFTHRAMAVVQSTALHRSIPSSRMTSSEPAGVQEDLSQRRLESVGKVSPV